MACEATSTLAADKLLGGRWVVLAACPFALPCSCLPVPPLPSWAPWGQAQCTNKSWQSQPCADLRQTFPYLLETEVENLKTAKNLFYSPLFSVLDHVCSIAKHIWVNGQEGGLSNVISLNFRPEKCKQHHFFKWRLGPMGWRWGKHVHSHTLNTESSLFRWYTAPSPFQRSTGNSSLTHLGFCKRLLYAEPFRSLRTSVH